MTSGLSRDEINSTILTIKGMFNSSSTVDEKRTLPKDFITAIKEVLSDTKAIDRIYFWSKLHAECPGAEKLFNGITSKSKKESKDKQADQ
jgi:hypothetical protein